MLSSSSSLGSLSGFNDDLVRGGVDVLEVFLV